MSWDDSMLYQVLHACLACFMAHRACTSLTFEHESTANEHDCNTRSEVVNGVANVVNTLNRVASQVGAPACMLHFMPVQLLLVGAHAGAHCLCCTFPGCMQNTHEWLHGCRAGAMTTPYPHVRHITALAACPPSSCLAVPAHPTHSMQHQSHSTAQRQAAKGTASPTSSPSAVQAPSAALAQAAAAAAQVQPRPPPPASPVPPPLQLQRVGALCCAKWSPRMSAHSAHSGHRAGQVHPVHMPPIHQPAAGPCSC